MGSLLIGLGTIALFVPLMPTTPFLLAAAGCYDKGSPRAHRWLLANPLFGPHLQSYQEGRGLSMRAKLASAALVVAGIAVSMALISPTPLIAVLLVLVASVVVVHIMTLPTARR